MDIPPNQRIHDVLLDIRRDYYQIPNIQRGFEWDKTRIVKLLDSIMNGYPIGAVMVWKPTTEVRNDISERSFIGDFRSDKDYLAGTPQPSAPEAYLVLDGQQRMQSLYLSFFGSYDGERVYIAIDHLPSKETDDDGYDFQFLAPEKAKLKPNMIPLAQIVKLDPYTKSGFIEKLTTSLAEMVGDKDERQRVKEEKKPKIETNIDTFIFQFNLRTALLFQEINSSITYDQVLEIFERANSLGMVLIKSDLLFSTLKLKLKEKEEEFRQTLNFINNGSGYGSRYEFNTDFIIKTSLVVFGKGAKYEVKKLRDDDYIQNLKDHYTVLDKCLRQLITWLDETALIKCDRFLPSKLALIPLIDYMILSGEHEKPDGLNSQAMKQYLYMAFFTRLFGRSSDAILDKIHKQLVLCIKGDAYAGIPPIGVDFPRSRLQKEGMGDIADLIGNYRLIVLPANRHKLAKFPDMNTDFFGKREDVKIASDYSDVLDWFSKTFSINRDSYSAFVSSREALIQSRVESFLDLKVIPNAER